ncbi:hypothetical protein GPECTOR_58g594 [Gonium pectorale]|uniref:Guanylate cyclase domain-containing protein n=1 Tax=Gonium pectorale TaxID=33097 RepID=A0A150G6I8_GONPE|nr:hypothetical protein GPECTOR_58g594 [Gonium pectorale]|eukprot:KXZ45145.1 hypothetical protein GPECTOR_58g594 [Gonium pectorale]
MSVVCCSSGSNGFLRYNVPWTESTASSALRATRPCPRVGELMGLSLAGRNLSGELPEAVVGLGLEVLLLADNPGCGGAGEQVTLVATDVEGSTELWEWQPDVMNYALVLHDKLMRLTMATCCGYEITTEGDAFLVAFHEPLDAVRWAMLLQSALLKLDWPPLLLEHPLCRPRPLVPFAEARHAPGGGAGGHGASAGTGSGAAPLLVLFKGLAVRMGVATGVPSAVREHPVTRRMQYTGAVLRLATGIAELGSGGQVLLEPLTFRGIHTQMEQLDVVEVEVQELAEVVRRDASIGMPYKPSAAPPHAPTAFAIAASHHLASMSTEPSTHGFSLLSSQRNVILPAPSAAPAPAVSGPTAPSSGTGDAASGGGGKASSSASVSASASASAQAHNPAAPGGPSVQYHPQPPVNPLQPTATTYTNYPPQPQQQHHHHNSSNANALPPRFAAGAFPPSSMESDLAGGDGPLTLEPLPGSPGLARPTPFYGGLVPQGSVATAPSTRLRRLADLVITASELGPMGLPSQQPGMAAAPWSMAAAAAAAPSGRGSTAARSSGGQHGDRVTPGQPSSSLGRGDGSVTHTGGLLFQVTTTPMMTSPRSTATGHTHTDGSLTLGGGLPWPPGAGGAGGGGGAGAGVGLRTRPSPTGLSSWRHVGRFEGSSSDVLRRASTAGTSETSDLEISVHGLGPAVAAALATPPPPPPLPVVPPVPPSPASRLQRPPAASPLSGGQAGGGGGGGSSLTPGKPPLALSASWLAPTGKPVAVVPSAAYDSSILIGESGIPSAATDAGEQPNGDPSGAFQRIIGGGGDGAAPSNAAAAAAAGGDAAISGTEAALGATGTCASSIASGGGTGLSAQVSSAALHTADAAAAAAAADGSGGGGAGPAGGAYGSSAGPAATGVLAPAAAAAVAASGGRAVLVPRGIQVVDMGEFRLKGLARGQPVLALQLKRLAGQYGDALQEEEDGGGKPGGGGKAQRIKAGAGLVDEMPVLLPLPLDAAAAEEGMELAGAVL